MRYIHAFFSINLFLINHLKGIFTIRKKIRKCVFWALQIY